VYSEYWIAEKALLLFPSTMNTEISVVDFIAFNAIERQVENLKVSIKKHEFSLGKIAIFKTENEKEVLDENIGSTILDWF
jgi:hypothetical protein